MKSLDCIVCSSPGGKKKHKHTDLTTTQACKSKITCSVPQGDRSARLEAQTPKPTANVLLNYRPTDQSQN